MKILYLHGIGSGAESRTARRIRESLGVDVIAPELPIRPIDAFNLALDIFSSESPDIIVGSSLGAFYAMMISGCKKVLINPAMHPDEDILNAIGIGEHEFFAQRSNGDKTYVIDEGFIDELKFMRESFFDFALDTGMKDETYAFFGENDKLFLHYEDFIIAYRRVNHAKLIDSGHRLEDKCLTEDVIPFIKGLIDKGEEHELK